MLRFGLAPLLALLAHVPWRATGALPFTESLYYSKGARSERVSGDARDPGVIAQLTQHAWKSEIILFDFTRSEHWLLWAENMCLQLHHVGFDHFSAVSREERDCEALWERVPTASCVWSSFPDAREHKGWAMERGSNDGLTLIRFSVLARLAAAGLNVLLLDLDCIFLRDPYPELKAPPLGNAQLVYMKEGYINSGLVYWQNARPGGAALWLVQHYIATALYNVATAHSTLPPVTPVLWNDQWLLNEAIEVAGCNRSVLARPRAFQSLRAQEVAAAEFWQRRAGPEWGSRTAAELAEAAKVDHRCVGIAPRKSTDRISAIGYIAPKDASPSWETYRTTVLEQQPYTYFDIRIPGDVALFPPWDINLPKVEPQRTAELAIAAPRWLFGGCPDVQAGWRSSAILHLVACGAAWHTHERPYPTRKSYMVSHQAWHVFPKEKGLRFLTVSPELVAAEMTRLGNTKAAAAAVFRRVMAAAAADNRVAVLPALDCSLPWILRASDTRLNVSDPSIVVYRDHCYPGAGGHACSSSHAVSAYELHAMRPREADVVTLHEWEGAPTQGSHAEQTARIAARATACFYYNEPRLER